MYPKLYFKSIQTLRSILCSLKFIKIAFKTWCSAFHKTPCVCVTKTNMSALFRELCSVLQSSQPVLEDVHRLWYVLLFFSNDSTAPWGPRPPHYRGFTITIRHTTLGRTPLDKWSARRRDIYLTTHNTHNRQTSMSPAGFEPAIPAADRMYYSLYELYLV
jgi:hypothetical protein